LSGFQYFQSLHIQRYVSRRFCTDSKSDNSDSLHLSGRRDIPFGRSTVQASSVRTTRTFCLDLSLCREPSNCSSLHPFGCLSNTARHLLVLDRLKDFFLKHRYGKTIAIVRTMCFPVQTLPFIRQVVHTKFNRSNVSLHGPDTQASYMKIVCISSTVCTSAFMVQRLKALIWKLCVAKVQLSGR